MKIILLLLLTVPLCGGALLYLLKRNSTFSGALSALFGLIHLGLTLTGFFASGKSADTLIPGWLVLDNTSALFLLITSILFTLCSLHCLRFLPSEEESLKKAGHGQALMKANTFYALLQGFLFSMTLVILAGNFGILWVAVESTTILSGPLILYHRSASSLEAMWKYLLICSVGIALALLGTMLLSLALPVTGSLHRSATLSFDDLILLRDHFSGNIFKAAFIFILAGYGTKMGLAPFHTWLPDAHSEAPGPVSALLSGALLNCSFLGIIRFLQITPEKILPFCNNFLLIFGFLSLATAGCFMIRQSDFKRMLAYSSVEHMGLLAILLAVSGVTSPLWKIHAFSHSLLKMTLFLIAGNLLIATGTRHIPSLGGLYAVLRKNALLWMIALLLICGVPPSPLFFTEFLMLFKLPLGLGALALFLLFTVFAAMSYNMLKMVMGPPGSVQPAEEGAFSAERLWKIPALALALILAGGTALLWVLACKAPLYALTVKFWEV